MLLEITSDALRPQFIVSSLPGWFLGVEDGRVWAPTVSEAQWNSTLLETGFSGVDTSCRDSDDSENYFFSVMTSQAVDNRVAVLQEPLTIHDNAPWVSDLLIVGSITQQVAQIVQKTHELLRPTASRVALVSRLEDIELHDVPSGAAIICLSDLEAPAFKDMTSERFEGIHKIFCDANYILWVTQVCRADDPYANMIIGLGRSILLETRHVKLQFLDLDIKESPNPVMFAESLIRLLCSDRPEYEGVLWSLEHEVSYVNGALYIPRILPNEVLNDRLNSERRVILKGAAPNGYPLLSLRRWVVWSYRGLRRSQILAYPVRMFESKLKLPLFSRSQL